MPAACLWPRASPLLARRVWLTRVASCLATACLPPLRLSRVAIVPRRCLLAHRLCLIICLTPRRHASCLACAQMKILGVSLVLLCFGGFLKFVPIIGGFWPAAIFLQAFKYKIEVSNFKVRFAKETGGAQPARSRTRALTVAPLLRVNSCRRGSRAAVHSLAVPVRASPTSSPTAIS